MTIKIGDSVRRKHAWQSKNDWGFAGEALPVVNARRESGTDSALLLDVGDGQGCYWLADNFDVVAADSHSWSRAVGDHLWKDLGHVLESDTGGKKNMRITRYDLLPPEALAEIAACFGVGEEKYPSTETGVPNWLLGMPWSWHVRALETHIQKWRSGVDFDEDDGIHHLAHAATLLMFLMTYSARDIGTDDRTTKR